MNISKNIKNKDEKNNIEYFHSGGVSKRKGGVSWPEEESSSVTSQYRCAKRNVDYGQFSYDVGSVRKKHTGFLIGPTEDDDSSYSIFNPVWLLFPVINLAINLFLDFLGIFTWFVNLLFMETYKMIVPTVANSLMSGSGITSGKKYCLNLSFFRYFIIILCPPAGVFMAYGFSGWLQILICCLASLFYYFPGLVYALIVTNRSEVADYMKQSRSDDCNESGLLGGVFVGDGANAPKCAAGLGEECTPDGKNPIGKDKDCCANPVLGADGVYTINGKVELDHASKPILSAEQGRIICRNDYKKLKSPKGMCVWKATGKP